MVKFLEAVLILSGMIIGVGMFGIPFSFAKAGFLLGAVLLFSLAVIMVVFHISYAQIVSQTVTSHRLPGYVRLYLGYRLSLLSWLAALLGIIGTLLVYILIGGRFLNLLLEKVVPIGGETLWALLIVFWGAIITAFPLRREALVNGILTLLLIFFVLFLSGLLLPQIKYENLLSFDINNIFLPYGVLLFALSGSIAIPDLVTLVGRDIRKSRRAIAVGTLIPAFLYFLFAVAVLGAVGSGVSEEAIGSLRNVAGDTVLFLGGVVGLLAVFTSFVVLSSNFQSLLRFDLGASRISSWFFASLLPPVFYFLGFHNFITIIAAIGTLAVGLDSALILGCYYKLLVKTNRAFAKKSLLWMAPLCVIITTGVLYELYLLIS